eukprot:CAMPEP_0194132320 /NCGR_PEP_ID=MMETSP0152-20130528/2820_1 /TAXON_ID=1049557 /ORGANISM="Thalassiothrix antarctica, Strain L6-D1" /LENGTH=98 /DNA_ID=CAMNT_0038827335 /DNA_START=51 /DNA_END=347 /DNA_ORIENTATION=-
MKLFYAIVAALVAYASAFTTSSFSGSSLQSSVANGGLTTMMAKKGKGVRIQITLESKTAAGVYRYHTQKNRRNNPERLELKKYCPLTRKVEVFKEIKK